MGKQKVVLDIKTAERLFSEHDELENAKLEIENLRKTLQEWKYSHLQIERKLDCANKMVYEIEHELNEQLNKLKDENEKLKDENYKIKVKRDTDTHNLIEEKENLKKLIAKINLDLIETRMKLKKRNDENG
ncbi:hypothetical protein [[Eubacterium] hominis]|uniref:hypothetical protein n=1 Tax=[Eubacterium] hominis TaxID=2764325 RepID=UPI0022E692E6